MTGIWQSLITTAAEVYEPDNGWGLAGLLIVNFGAIITACGTVWVLVRQRRTDAKVAKVEAVSADTNAQVANGKPVAEGGTAFRTDLDEKFDQLGKKIDGVHELVVRHLEDHIHHHR